MGFFDQHMKHAEHVQPQQQAPTANQQPQINPPIQPQLQQRAVTPFPISNEMISCADQIKGQGKYAKRFKTIAYHEEQFRPYPKDTRYYVGTLGTIYDSVNNVKLFPVRVHRGFNPLIFNYYLSYYLNGTRSTGHRMVAETFLPKPKDPNANIVNHKNGIKSDNRVDNLEWVTHKQNVEHAFRTGLIKPLKGEDSSQAKFSNKEIEEICKMLEDDEMNNSEIALKFGFTSDMCSTTNKKYRNFLALCNDIRNKRSWRSISDNYNIRKRKNLYREESELERICQLICDGRLTNAEIVAKIKEEFNHNISEASVRMLKYCNPKYRPSYWRVVKKYKDQFPIRPSRNFNDEDIHKICKMLEEGANKSEIAQAVGMENDTKFRAILSHLRNGQIYSKITSKYNLKPEYRKRLTKDEAWKILEYRLVNRLSIADIAKLMEVDNSQSFRVAVFQILRGRTFSEVREEFRKKYNL